MQLLSTRVATTINSLMPFKHLAFKPLLRHEATVTFNIKSTGIGIRSEILLSNSLIDSSSSVVLQRDTINLLSDSMPFSILLVPILGYWEHSLILKSVYKNLKSSFTPQTYRKPLKQELSYRLLNQPSDFIIKLFSNPFFFISFKKQRH